MSAIRFSEHYSGQYGRYVQERRVAGSQSIAMFEMLQPAGDFSDPAVSDMVIIETRSSLRGNWDFGAGRIYAAESRLIYVVPPHCPTDIVIDHPHLFRAFSIAPLQFELQEDFSTDGPPDFARLQHRGTRSPLLTHLLQRLWETGLDAGNHGCLFADSIALTLAMELWREAGQKVRFAKGGLSPPKLKRVQEFIEAELESDISLADLAKVAELSAFHFSRSFKRECGMSPFQYLAKRRIARAQLLLETTDQVLVEISSHCGFADQSSFTTAFNREVGVTPGRWRRMLAETVGKH